MQSMQSGGARGLRTSAIDTVFAHTHYVNDVCTWKSGVVEQEVESLDSFLNLMVEFVYGDFTCVSQVLV